MTHLCKVQPPSLDQVTRSGQIQTIVTDFQTDVKRVRHTIRRVTQWILDIFVYSKAVYSG